MAYTISRLINIDANIQLDPESKGHEFGYCAFDSLPDISTLPKQEVVINILNNTILIQDTNLNIGISNTELKSYRK